MIAEIIALLDEPRIAALAALGCLRLLALCLLVAAAAHLLADTTADLRIRRRTSWRQRSRRMNQSLMAGFMLQLSGSAGLVLLITRQLLLKATGEGWWYFLLFRDPDLIGVVSYAACSALIALGGILTVRGVRSLVGPRVSGELPRGMRVRRSHGLT